MKAPPNLANEIFLVPKAGGDFTEDQATDLAQTLIVERERFGFSGSECNKIGVGYTAFSSQGSRCSQPLGSCLGNQVSDLYNEDQDRFYQGLTPKYHYAGTFPGEEVNLVKKLSTE